LTIAGDLTLNSSSIINIEIEGNNAATPEFDIIDVNGEARLDGTLNVTLPTGYNPVGSSFNIINTGGTTGNDIGGNFATVNAPFGYSMSASHNTINYTSNNFVLLGDILWDNSSGDGLWMTATNWNTDVLPISTDKVIIADATGALVSLDNASVTIDTLMTNEDLSITNSADLTVTNDTSLSNNMTIENNGKFITGDDINGSATIIINNTGTLELNNDNTINPAISNAGNLIKTSGTVATGSVLNGILTNTGKTQVNAGKLTLTSTGWNNAGTIDLLNGTQFVISAGDLTNNGLISGFGTLQANTLINSGDISPGASQGTLTINGNYTQTSTGKLTMELGNTGTNDSLVVTGNTNLDGSLVLTGTLAGYNPGTSPVNGNNYVLINSSTSPVVAAGLTITPPSGNTYTGSVNANDNYIVTYSSVSSSSSSGSSSTSSSGASSSSSSSGSSSTSSSGTSSSSSSSGSSSSSSGTSGSSSSSGSSSTSSSGTSSSSSSSGSSTSSSGSSTSSSSGSSSTSSSSSGGETPLNTSLTKFIVSASTIDPVPRVLPSSSPSIETNKTANEPQDEDEDEEKRPNRNILLLVPQDTINDKKVLRCSDI